jgi:peptidyl-tRNA hydrolase, PTH1 family
MKEHLIVGLGNPESDYAETRHNLGVDCVKALAVRWNLKINRRRWDSLTAHAEERGVWFLLPQTFMNESGRAVAKALRDTGIDPVDIWLVHDELDLPFCQMRISHSRSAAGHNGVKSVIDHLQTKAFLRFRVGVGKPARRGPGPGRAYVLGGFSPSEAKHLESVVNGVADALELALDSGAERAMDRYNRAGALGCEEPA